MRSAAWVFFAGVLFGVWISAPPWAHRYLLIGAAVAVIALAPRKQRQQ